MAAPGKGLATLIDVDGYDPYRVYSEEPLAGSWRELRDPVGGQRYWHHVSARITTWSRVELLRLNGLEEFLQVGEWGVFAVVPEDVKTYEVTDLDGRARVEHCGHVAALHRREAPWCCTAFLCCGTLPRRSAAM
jgi:hypothetical protein